MHFGCCGESVVARSPDRATVGESRRVVARSPVRATGPTEGLPKTPGPRPMSIVVWPVSRWRHWPCRGSGSRQSVGQICLTTVSARGLHTLPGKQSKSTLQPSHVRIDTPGQKVPGAGERQ